MHQEALHVLTPVVAGVAFGHVGMAPPAIFQPGPKVALQYLPGQQQGTGKIGLQFKGIRAAWVLIRTHDEGPMPEDWPPLLQREELPPFPLEIETCSFDPEMAIHMWKMAEQQVCLFGETYENLKPEFFEKGVCLAFWAGNAGCFLAADSLQVLHVTGEIAL